MEKEKANVGDNPDIWWKWNSSGTITTSDQECTEHYTLKYTPYYPTHELGMITWEVYKPVSKGLPCGCGEDEVVEDESHFGESKAGRGFIELIYVPSIHVDPSFDQ
jgi:hypothetical protein